MLSVVDYLPDGETKYKVRAQERVLRRVRTTDVVDSRVTASQAKRSPREIAGSATYSLESILPPRCREVF